METIKPFAYQQPSRAQTLLESLLQARGRLPTGARPVIDRGELPSPLQKLVIKLHDSDQVWSAWIDEEHIWFFTAEVSLALSRERGRPTLEVGSYNVDGTMKEWQLWVCLNDGTWQQCAL